MEDSVLRLGFFEEKRRGRRRGGGKGGKRVDQSILVDYTERMRVNGTE